MEKAIVLWDWEKIPQNKTHLFCGKWNISQMKESEGGLFAIELRNLKRHFFPFL